jgi:hypothetical protein
MHKALHLYFIRMQDYGAVHDMLGSRHAEANRRSTHTSLKINFHLFYIINTQDSGIVHDMLMFIVGNADSTKQSVRIRMQ